MNSNQVDFGLGTQRIQDPIVTLEWVSPFATEMGITRVADVTYLDCVGVPVVMVSRPNARSVSVSQGKGSTVAAAKVSGLMESIEGFHAEHPVVPVRLDCLDVLLEARRVAPVGLLPQVEGSGFGAGVSIPWVVAEDLVLGIPVLCRLSWCIPITRFPGWRDRGVLRRVVMGWRRGILCWRRRFTGFVR